MIFCFVECSNVGWPSPTRTSRKSPRSARMGFSFAKVLLLKLSAAPVVEQARCRRSSSSSVANAAIFARDVRVKRLSVFFENLNELWPRDAVTDPQRRQARDLRKSAQDNNVSSFAHKAQRIRPTSSMSTIRRTRCALCAKAETSLSCARFRRSRTGRLRIGYGIARPELIEILQKTRQPFNTNSLAQTAALAALDDEEHLRATRCLTTEGRAI